MRTLAAALCFAVATLAVPAVAQDKNADVTDMQALRAAVKADKRAFVAATLGLTDAEAKRFWPVYEQYQADVAVANRMRAVTLEGLLSRSGPITDLYAKQLARELVASDENEVKARRALYNRVMRALPAKKAGRYLQLESKIRALQNYDIAVAFPLIN